MTKSSYRSLHLHVRLGVIYHVLISVVQYNGYHAYILLALAKHTHLLGQVLYCTLKRQSVLYCFLKSSYARQSRKESYSKS